MLVHALLSYRLLSNAKFGNAHPDQPAHFRQLPSCIISATCNLLKNGHTWLWNLLLFQMFPSFVAPTFACHCQELDFLDGPKQGRSLRPRSRNSKGSTAPAPPEATPAEGAAPRAREAKGAKYGRDGLWAMLHPNSERSSESEAWRNGLPWSAWNCWKFVGWGDGAAMMIWKKCDSDRYVRIVFGDFRLIYVWWLLATNSIQGLFWAPCVHRGRRGFLWLLCLLWCLRLRGSNQELGSKAENQDLGSQIAADPRGCVPITKQVWPDRQT